MRTVSMKSIASILASVLLASFSQSCFREESNGFINRMGVGQEGGTFVVKGETGVYSLEMGEGSQMDAYHEEFIEPDTVVVKNDWLEAKARIGSNRIIITVDPLHGEKKRRAPITAYSGYEYAVIWVTQSP